MTKEKQRKISELFGFTPGPWEADHEYIVGQVPQGRPGGEVIARADVMASRLHSVVPHMVNAKLICKAPEMLFKNWERSERLKTIGDKISEDHGAATAQPIWAEAIEIETDIERYYTACTGEELSFEDIQKKVGK